MSDQERLAGYVDVWWQAVNAFTDLLEELPADAWSAPTDCPGWDVRAVAAHVAHLEAVLAGAPEESAEIGEPAHVTGLTGMYTEIGVVNRREASPDALINEIRGAVTARHTALLADPPTDGEGSPPVVAGGVPWTWERLLRNRPLDVWMHEQDVRRAVGLPGGMDSPAAQHTADYLTESFGFVLAKRAGAPVGTTAVLSVVGSAPVAFAVGDDGRGMRLEQTPAEPTLALSMDRETFVLLAGGRRTSGSGEAGSEAGGETAAVRVEGDAALAERVVAAMATTP